MIVTSKAPTYRNHSVPTHGESFFKTRFHDECDEFPKFVPSSKEISLSPPVTVICPRYRWLHRRWLALARSQVTGHRSGKVRTTSCLKTETLLLLSHQVEKVFSRCYHTK